MLSQFIADGLIAGCMTSLLAVAFAVIFQASRFFVFTFAASYAWAAYARLFLEPRVGVLGAVLLAVTLGIAFGTLLERFLYRPMREWGKSRLTLMLASIGAYTVLQSLISLFFGDAARSVREFATPEGFAILGARTTAIQLLVGGVSLGLVIAVCVSVARSSLGRRLRAIGSDPELARILGVDVDRAVLLAVALGSGLAAVAGVLSSTDTGLIPSMGFQALVLGIVGMTLGGASIPGSAVGGMVLGFLTSVVAWKLPTQWQETFVYLALLVLLALGPRALVRRRLEVQGP